MADIGKKLISKFDRQNRYQNFGTTINEMNVAGFRGVTTEIRFDFPVTALTGLNGAGKSTLGQLALCAYKQLSTSSLKRFYVKDFFPVSAADPKPITSHASVTYKYQTDQLKNEQELTVTRAVKEWSGYKRQPEGAAIYIGLAFYLPKVERKDLTIYAAKNLVLSERINIEGAQKHVSRILGGKYEEVFFQAVQNNKRTAELGMASRLGYTYSENNMGFGEGRVVHTIRLLETCPEQSLVVLEEPETSLHEFAQYEFVKYLMDVSNRRGHQIIFSTHSSVMIDALPPVGRKLLTRDENGVSVADRLSSERIKNALSEGHKGHLIVCVEDKFAQSLLRELIKRRASDILSAVKVQYFGDAKAVAEAVRVLRKSDVKAIAVRDADQPEIPDEDIFKLPGVEAPEKDIFLDAAAKQVLKDEFSFDLDTHLAGHPETDHHDYAKIVADKTNFSLDVVETDCIRAVLRSRDEQWGAELVSIIRDRT